MAAFKPESAKKVYQKLEKRTVVWAQDETLVGVHVSFELQRRTEGEGKFWFWRRGERGREKLRNILSNR